MKINRLYLLLVLVIQIACREVYEPEIVQSDLGYLVVEGFVEVGGGETILKLARTVSVYQEQTFKPITNAKVSLQGAHGDSWKFQHRQEGIYHLEENLPVHQDYRLHIEIGDFDKYESDWLSPYVSPEIENLYFEREEDGVYIYVDSDKADEGGFMLWTAEETWQFRSAFNSLYEYELENFQMIFREQNINVCYRHQSSERIVLGSTDRHADGFNKLEVMRIPLLSEKLGIRYSIEVMQRQIDQRAFEFWEALRRNTEDIGNIFSPMPAYFGSNIYKVGDENEPVIGYISAGKSSKRRIYISFVDVRPWGVRIPEYSDCRRITLATRHIPFLVSREYLPINIAEGGEDWDISTSFCVDCRERGVLEVPEFWE